MFLISVVTQTNLYTIHNMLLKTFNITVTESFTKSGDKNYSFNSSRGSLGSTKENVSNSSERSNQTRSKLNASQLNKSSDKSHSQNDLRDAYANDSLYRNLSSSRSNNSQNSSSKNKTCDSSKGVGNFLIC